ncbi:hypothetical protein GCM10017790_14590 [Amycolatopsis oliviviridis]|uniref:Uncharacterized protein n=1 Tax=Amycolatopsis oliviviridis TaxID=1471590 RepID=A0ABQ3L7H1_9PSEU|nr:hypothetical protein GCM10017790_14590 [Amycolatopsis oliviviridis]
MRKWLSRHGALSPLKRPRPPGRRDPDTTHDLLRMTAGEGFPDESAVSAVPTGNYAERMIFAYTPTHSILVGGGEEMCRVVR